MKKSTTIILIALFVILFLFFIFTALYVAGGLSLYVIYERQETQNALEVQQLENIARDMTIKHLQTKYPQQEFSILEIEVDELYNGFVHAGWDSRVNVTIFDSEKEYQVIAYTDYGYGDSLDKKCIDNVQEKEILNAIQEETEKAFNVTLEAPTRIEIDIGSNFNGSFYFYEFFDGNLVEFFKRESSHRDGDPEFIIHCYTNSDIIMLPTYSNNPEFLDLCKFAVCVNLDEEIPQNYIPLFRWIEAVIEDVKSKGYSVKQAFWYDEDTHEFTDATNMLTIN